MQISASKVVLLDYTLKGDDGQVLDSTTERGPMAYLHGTGTIVPGLESALEGKSEGAEVQVVVPPADGFGMRDEALRQVVPREQFEEFPDLSVGMKFRVPTDDGDATVTIVEVSDDSVIVDGNHELAGLELHFDVSIREVRDATEEEISHGHVHGPGGHHH